MERVKIDRFKPYPPYRDRTMPTYSRIYESLSHELQEFDQKNHPASPLRIKKWRDRLLREIERIARLYVLHGDTP